MIKGLLVYGGGKKFLYSNFQIPHPIPCGYRDFLGDTSLGYLIASEGG